VTTVLHLIESSEPGGAEKILASLVQKLDPERFRSVVALLDDGWLYTELVKGGHETHVLPQKRGLDAGWVGRCADLIRRYNVRLVHAHEFAMNVYGGIAARRVNVPIIATVHGTLYAGEKWRRRLAYRLVARYADRMVAVSDDVKRFLVERVGVQPAHLTTIHNGIDTTAFEPPGQKDTIRRELGISEGSPVIGTTGALRPVKGHTYLLKAMHGVVKEFPGATLVIAGEGPLLKELQDEAIKLGIEQNVRFLGFREDVAALLECMDVFVLPSLSEGFSLSLLEAMGAGKPVVATDVGGNAEALGGGTGLLVPAQDPDGLAARLILLLRDQHLARRLASGARRRVREHFGLDRMVKSYRDLYESALLKVILFKWCLWQTAELLSA